MTHQLGAQFSRVPLVEPHAAQVELVDCEATCQPVGQVVPHM
jgi:hypothetical protein